MSGQMWLAVYNLAKLGNEVLMKHKKGEDIHGWLVINKPAGMGSTDVVNQTRKMFNAKKNGHTGTLDPFATGVLPIAFGEATKLIPYVMDAKKEYEFVVVWGKNTDSGDLTGQVIETNDKIPSREEIFKVIPDFIGEIKQIPPAYSAIKINGRRAYDLVRKGQEVEIPERTVTIYDLQWLEDLPLNRSRFKVCCSKGTYVRTLAMDLAQKLGTCGYLEELCRTKCGIFSIEDTILLEKLKKVVHSEDLKQFLLPLLTSLRDIAVIALSEADAEKLKLGQSISPKSYDVKNLYGKEVAAVFQQKLTAIVRIEEQKIAPVRVFNY